MSVCKACKGRFDGCGRHCPRCAEVAERNRQDRYFNGKWYMSKAQAGQARAKVAAEAK